MHTYITGGNSRSKTKTFIHRTSGLPASMRDTAPGLLTREDLRHLVAEMVD
ncbi:hypothetical protein [Novosphingobium sp. BL-52-GroH]|uniref:hypothetical protein n=1 Tax=Novosphingobium sp. BL-52-GroH TaxID=3349877 RepID=UPI003850A77C